MTIQPWSAVVVPPGSQVERMRINDTFTNRWHVLTIGASVSFRDAAGYYWQRDPFGQLIRLTTKPVVSALPPEIAAQEQED